MTQHRAMYWALFAFMMFMLAETSAFATIRYVDNTLPGTCSSPSDTDYDPAAGSGVGACGSGSNPVYNSISGALGAVAAGDTVYIRSGTYVSMISASMFAVSGTESAPITVARYQSETATLAPGGCGVVSFPDATKNYIVIDGLVLDATSASCTDQGGAAVGAANGAHHITIKNSEWKNGPFSAMLAAVQPVGNTSPHHWTLENNHIHDFGLSTLTNNQNALYLSVLRDSIIRGNNIHDSECFAVRTWASNLAPTHANQSANNIVEYNYIHDNGKNYTVSWASQCTATGGGINPGGLNNIYRHNIVVHNNLNAIQGSSNQVSGVQAYNNTFYNNNVGIYLLENTQGSVTIKNNITVGNNANYLIGSGAAAPTSTNNACPGGSCGTSSVAISAITDCTVSTSDFTLKSGSSCINQGTTISGRTYNGVADIGAFEAIPAPTLALASGNTVDVTIPMSTNTPVLPATGQTTWVVKFGGTPRTTVSAVKLSGSDSVVRLTYDGAACSSSDVMTIDYTSGTVSDSALIGGSLNQKLFSFTGLAVDESACTGGGGGTPPANSGIIYDMNNISGTNVPDTSGNANHGTTSGSPTVLTGLIDDALSFADGVADFITAPHGSGINPTTQSGTYCILVSPDSTSNTRTYMGTPFGTDQRFFLSIINGTWSQGIQASTVGQNNDFPVQAGWSFPCIEFNASTDKATLIVNGVRGTTENGTTGASIKPYTSYTFAGNLTIGMASGFLAGTAPGGDIDHFVYYPNVLTAQEMTDLYNSLVNPSPPPSSSTREQKGHKFQRPFKKAGAAEDLRGVDEDGRVSRGGYVDVVIQLDCTGDDCPSFAPRIHRSIDGGATYAQINDVCGVICFAGTSTNPDLVSADVECCLTGALTEVDGPTNFTSAAVPSITLSQDHSITLRYKLKVDASATPGQEIYLKVYDQNGNELEGGYTPALGAKLTVKDYANGGGF